VHDIPHLWQSLEPFQDDNLERVENSCPGHHLATLVEMRQSGIFRGRRRSVAVVVTVAVLVVAAAGVAAGYLLLRTVGSPRQTAASYLRGWQQGRYAAMQKVSVNVPRSGLADPLRQAAAELGVRHLRLAPGPVTASGGSAVARFTATADLVSGHTWTYTGRLRLVRQDHRWWVSWSPAAIYPGLRAGQRFVLSAAWPPRAPVLAADGTVLSSPQVIAESGSIQLLTGSVVTATAAQARALGAPYLAGDQIGQGGIEQVYQARLAGRPSLTIRIEGPASRVDATAARFAASPGLPVTTSIDMRYQLAASQAIRSADTTKPVDMVVIQPSTGKVLAVVERPGGFDRALLGEFPPGSTFKVVTASALARTGMRPSSAVQCPSQVDIGGRIFHNDDNERLGATNLQTAFAVSCNSTFAMLATQHLDGAALASMAAAFGFNATPTLGVAAILGQFTTPSQPVDLAADAFGQGTDLVNPLSQATVAAAIEHGSWLPPQLVTSPAPRQAAQPRAISAAILATLRPMMRAVVTSGTAAGVGFPPGVYGKTGTAQYGNGPNPPSHGWFIGYRGDLAFAVLVEGGGLGADSAGPIANAFLRKL
jgi:transpeptidase family protein/MecA-like transpeptidase family protein